MSRSDTRKAITEALERVEQGTPEDWREAAFALVIALARTQAIISADDFWEAMRDAQGNVWYPPTRAALGPVFLRAAAAGFIRKADAPPVVTRLPIRHRTITLWESSCMDGKT